MSSQIHYPVVKSRKYKVAYAEVRYDLPVIKLLSREM